MNKPGLSSLEISWGMKQIIFTGFFTSCFFICIAPQFLTGLASALGATDRQFALLTSLPMLGLALQFFSTLLTQQLRQRKPCWFLMVSVHRLLWIPIAVLPLMPLFFHSSPQSVLIIFFFLFFLSSILGSMSTPLWFSWMADLVPKEQAGKFWGRRVALASLTNVLAIPIGWFVDCFPKNEAAPYALLFLLAAILGQTEIFITNRVVEPPAAPSAITGSLWKLIGLPFRLPDFRKLLVFTCVYNFAVFFADWYVIVFFLTKAGLSQSFIALAASMMWIMRWAMARYWGFLGDRFGHAAILRICAVALVVWPIAIVFWGHSHPRITLMGIYLYMGFFNVGFETAFTSLLMGLTPASNKSLYVSLLHAFAGLVAAIAPLLGSVFLEWSSSHAETFGSMEPFQWLFLAGILLRLTAVIICPLKFQAVRGASPTTVVRRLMDANPFRVIHHSCVLDEGVQESQRVDAVYELAGAVSDIASQQLIEALHDPSLAVRRGAVRALVKIGDRSSLPALLSLARSPEAQIQAEAIEALGLMGDRSITPFLLSLLDNPHLRLPALRSLADLRDPASLEAVRPWSLSETAPLEERATALEARCNLGDETVIMPCIHFLRQCAHEIPRWQVVMALEKMTLAPLDLYSVLQRELRVQGEVIAADSQLVQHSPLGRQKAAHLRKAASALARKAQAAYMDGEWRQAVVGFTLATLVCLQIIPAATAESAFPVPSLPERALKLLEKNLALLVESRSRTSRALHLAEALLRMENTPASRTVREEAILAYCLLRKLLGYT